MKKVIFTIFVLLTIFLAACSGQANLNAKNIATSATPATTAAQSEILMPELSTTYENAASKELQLLAGSFKLQETDLAITQEQAVALLPLWTQLETLVQNSMTPRQWNQAQGDASATPQPLAMDEEKQAQISSLVDQILADMTAEQIQAIADMQITRENAMTILQDQGIAMGGPGQGGGMPGSNGGQPPSGDSNGAGQPPSGSPPAGNPGDQGGQPPSGSPPSGDSSGDSQPPAMPNGDSLGNGMIMPQWLDAIIQLLTTISTGQTSAVSGQPAQNPSTSGVAESTGTGAYTLDSGSETLSGRAFTAGDQDESAILVTNGGTLTLSSATITTSGNTSSQDNSSFYGLNAAVLAEAGSTISLSDSRIVTSGTGANGAFATGKGTTVNLTNVTIDATADGAHGVMATQGGTLSMTNVDINTSGGSSSAIATDRGSGTIAVIGGKVTTSGQNSAGIYSTGIITVSSGTFTSNGAEAAVIEGGNSITLTDTSLTTTKQGKWGVMIYQSMSGDAEGTRGTFTMTGGNLASTDTTGPLFYVTNSTAIITLKNVILSAASGILLNASAGNWGNSGSNGGTAVLTADQQSMIGDLSADSLSSIALTLQNQSSLNGAINTAHTAREANLTLDASSSWTVAGDSYVTCIADAGGISGTSATNITGNGHTVYYDGNACPGLGGATYTLVNGGTLKPAS